MCIKESYLNEQTTNGGETGGAVITICLILFCVNVDAHELCLRALLIKMENLSDFYLHMDDSIFCTLYQVSAGPVSIKTV